MLGEASKFNITSSGHGQGLHLIFCCSEAIFSLCVSLCRYLKKNTQLDDVLNFDLSRIKELANIYKSAKKIGCIFSL